MFRWILAGAAAFISCAPQGHSQKSSPTAPAVMPERPASQGGLDTLQSRQPEEPKNEERVESPCRFPGALQGPWWIDAVGYEVFVRSFKDTDGDGIGDLPGLQEKLGYLEDLGVDLIWLMPILQSPSYHGYDVSDYREVEADYGSKEDLASLLSQANTREIRVIMDFVMNHASDQHPWFIESAQDTKPGARDRFIWSPENQGWTQPWGGAGSWHNFAGAWFYGLFSPSMPDWNLENPEVEEELTLAAESWLDFGFNGFRLDAVRYLVESGPGDGQKDQEATHQIWSRFREAMENRQGAPLLLGEAWAELPVAAAYFGSESQPEMGMVFDFDGATAMLQATLQGSSAPLKQAWCSRWTETPSWGAWGTFLSNHDQDRVGSVLENLGLDGLKTAAALLLLSPGTPWIYYGEELGAMNGPSWGDMGRREPMHWNPGNTEFSKEEPWTGNTTPPPFPSVQEQLNQSNSLFQWYQRLIALRQEHESLRRGSAEWLTVTPDALALLRETPTEQCIVLVPLESTSSTFLVRDSRLGGNWTSQLVQGSWRETEEGIELDTQGSKALLLCRSSSDIE